jgi:hypothetical protein
MSRINDLKATGFELLSELDALLKQKEQMLAQQVTPIEVKILMSTHYQRLEHRRKKVMEGIEGMHPEIKN